MTLTKTGEKFSWDNPVTTVLGLLSKLYLHYSDYLTVKNLTTGDEAKMKFVSTFFGKSKNRTVQGEIKDKQGRVRLKLEANWQEYCDVILNRNVERELAQRKKEGR